MATVKNTISGIVAEVPEHYLDHPILGANLVAFSNDEVVAPKPATTKLESSAPSTNK